MGSIRGRRSVAYICLAAVLLAALVPGLSAGDLAIPEPSWILLPDLAVFGPARALIVVDFRSHASCAPRHGRAPPASLV